MTDPARADGDPNGYSNDLLPVPPGWHRDPKTHILVKDNTHQEMIEARHRADLRDNEARQTQQERYYDWPSLMPAVFGPKPRINYNPFPGLPKVPPWPREAEYEAFCREHRVGKYAPVNMDNGGGTTGHWYDNPNVWTIVVVLLGALVIAFTLLHV